VNSEPCESLSNRCTFIFAILEKNREDGLLLIFRHPALRGASFGMTIGPDPGSITSASSLPLAIHYWLDDLPASFVLDAFGLRFAAVENMRAYLPVGSNCWDGSSYQEPEAMPAREAERRETGFAMAQILPRFGGGSVVLGFDRHDRFQHTFAYDTRQRPVPLTVQTLWDRKAPSGGRCASECLVAYAHPGVEAALRAWAELLARRSPLPPRLDGPGITGWSSWYNLYSYVNETILLEHLHAAAEVARHAGLPMRVFQIDDGFITEAGDWLEIKPQFPRGMRALMDEIRATGFIPGLWIAPFMVGCRSHLYQEHPDWVVKDAHTGQPFVPWHLYGEFRWHKRSEDYYILDTTHPEAFAHLRELFHIYRHEWGVEYFKTDGMAWGADYGPDRVVHHTPGMTRIAIFHRVLEMIRQEIGPDTP
jgi:alpha-galactosidase